MAGHTVANDLTAEQVRTLLEFDPLEGVFRWRSIPAQRGARGRAEAGRLNNFGTRQISINGREYTARRLAWLFVFGEWPAERVEPINQDPDDLRISNLAQMKRQAGGALTADRLRALLDYDKSTGAFTWTSAAYSTRLHGETAGCATGARVLICVDGHQYFAHRLAVLHVTGSWPRGVVDHKNGEPKHNGWANLRDVDARTNSENQRRSHAGSTSKFLGVSWRKDRKKWQAAIRVDRKLIHLGLFDVEADAGEAYVRAKRQVHAGCEI